MRLNKRQLEVLRLMKDGEELVYENGVGYVGYTRVGPSTVLALMRAVAIRACQDSDFGRVERYVIGEIGRQLLGGSK